MSRLTRQVVLWKWVFLLGLFGLSAGVWAQEAAVEEEEGVSGT